MYANKQTSNRKLPWLLKEATIFQVKIKRRVLWKEKSFGVDRKKSASVQAENSIQPRTIDSQYPKNLMKKKFLFPHRHFWAGTHRRKLLFSCKDQSISTTG